MIAYIFHCTCTTVSSDFSPLTVMLSLISRLTIVYSEHFLLSQVSSSRVKLGKERLFVCLAQYSGCNRMMPFEITIVILITCSGLYFR